MYFYDWGLRKCSLEGRRNEARLKLQLLKHQLSYTLAKMQREGSIWSFLCFGNVLACVRVRVRVRCDYVVVLFLS